MGHFHIKFPGGFLLRFARTAEGGISLSTWHEAIGAREGSKDALRSARSVSLSEPQLKRLREFLGVPS